MDEFEWAKSYSSSFSASNYDNYNDIGRGDKKHPITEPPNASQRPQGSLSSFICHVLYLERKLRSDTPILLDSSANIQPTGKTLGEGRTFIVRHARWTQKPQHPPMEVALKEIIPTSQWGDKMPETSALTHWLRNDWKDLLFELRAMLHEPLRWHPNLIQILGVQWGLSPLTESVFPMLVMECSSLGTLRDFQASVEPLSFPIKQKLCYDIGKGLSILHSCGIVHGDVKHENVLIFPNNDPATTVVYKAKLADFGGTVMDMGDTDVRKMDTWTWPFQDPEIDRGVQLTRKGMMLTDVYSFGLLIWRVFTDGEGIVSCPGAGHSAPDEFKASLTIQKSTDDFTSFAIADVYKYARSRSLPKKCLDLIIYAVLHTIRFQPSDRSLTSAQSALRGIKLGKINAYENMISEKNVEWETMVKSRHPGSHGITQEAFIISYGRLRGLDVDLQRNLPGFLPEYEQPDIGEFLFEPQVLKRILTWEQQEQIVHELKEIAVSITNSTSTTTGIKRTVAAFYLFQCHLSEFGTALDNYEALRWLVEAAADHDSHEETDYLAQAWYWRINRAISAHNNFLLDDVSKVLRVSIMRGHRTCLQDMLDISSDKNGEESQYWLDSYALYGEQLRSHMGGVGTPYFLPHRMNLTFTLDNINRLEEQIRVHLGPNYDECLETQPQDSAKFKVRTKSQEKTKFDDILVNNAGHGLLHFAAARGAYDALKHMITRYKCNIDLPSLRVYETPLVCACVAGGIGCARLLLAHGADPNGYENGEEGPLHWLSSFDPNGMEEVGSELLAAGAELEHRSGTMRHDIRNVRSDWEHLFQIQVTPLGRAVLMNNHDAIRLLLKLGANPLTQMARCHPKRWEYDREHYNEHQFAKVSSAFQLAAVLTLPEILETFIKHADQVHGGYPDPRVEPLDEASMLEIAHSKKLTVYDPLSLQSRLVRCGASYKSDLRKTISLLYTRAAPKYPDEGTIKKRSIALCGEVAFGNVDIVECLLDLGYDVNGTDDFRPLEKAIDLNHDGLFEILIRHKANVMVTRSTLSGNISMLHLCASRPRQSRPGRVITDALIGAGVPVESVDTQCKSPLVVAVLNQNFDVARALLEHGADVDVTFPKVFHGTRGPETRAVTMLIEVLAEHTMRTLESLRFLFGKMDGGPKKRPNFIVDQDSRISILHFLAGSELFTEIAQITPLILNLCLDTYSEPSCINYRHQSLGTPLYYAAMNGNKAMVERLRDRGADLSCNAGPHMTGSVKQLLRENKTWSPLWASIVRFDEELNKLSLLSGHRPRANNGFLQSLEKVVELLSHTGDSLARKAIVQLNEKKNKLLVTQVERKREYTAFPEDLPVDLSGLCGGGTDDADKALLEIEDKGWRMLKSEQSLIDAARKQSQQLVIE